MPNLVNTVLRGIYDGLASRSSDSLDSPMKIPSGDITNGDVSIMSIKAYKYGGQAEADYKEYVTELHIYESIVSPAVYCTMTVKDAVGMAEYFKLEVKDLVHIKFQTPNAETCEYIFSVNEPEISKTRSPNLAFDVYVVELVSVRALEAMEVTMESFDLRDTAGNLIKKILREKIDVLPGAVRSAPWRQFPMGHYVDTGTGIIGRNKLQLSVLPKNSNGNFRRPFEVIHQLTLLNNISPEGHSLYTFFEREDGYWFKPIEKLMSDGKKLIEQGQSEKIFYYDNLRNQDDASVKFRNILAYSILTKGGRGGDVNTQSRNLNPDTGEISSPDVPTDAGINITSLTNAQALNKFSEITRTDFTTSTEFDHLNRLMVERTRLLSRLSQYEAQVMIYGDSSIAVGDVIECHFPKPTAVGPAQGDNNPSSELSTDSGFYLITHLCHIILNTSRPQYAISCNLMSAEDTGS
jgi:hypothetical protein